MHDVVIAERPKTVRHGIASSAHWRLLAMTAP